MDVLGISRRSAFNKVKRAYAYDFPLNAFSRGGRPTVETCNQGHDEERATAKGNVGDEQQRLDDVTDEDLGRVETCGCSDVTNRTTGTVARSDDGSSASGPTESEARSQNDELHRTLRRAIKSIEAADEAL